MRYSDSFLKKRKKNEYFLRLCEFTCVLMCACVFVSAYVSCGDDSEKVKVKRKIIGVSWSEKRRIQMDLIPSFSFDVSSHHFIVVCFVHSLWCLYPSEKERETIQQHNVIVVVRLKLYFHSYCFCLDTNFISNEYCSCCWWILHKINRKTKI